MERALAGIPAVLRSLMDALDDVVFFAKDLQGRYRLVNQTLVQRVGLQSKQQVLGRRTDDLFPEPFGVAFRLQDEAVLRSGRAIENRLELHFYSNASTGWCRTYKAPLTDQGKVVGLMGFSKDLHRKASDRTPAGVARAIAYLEENLVSPLRVSDLAREAGMAQRSFERAVRTLYQASAGDLIVQARVDRACRLLTSTDGSIASIAQDCGYSEHSAFSRQFRARVGVTPREFRGLVRAASK